MIVDLTNIQLDKLVTHFVGNKLRDEKYRLSNEITDFEDNSTQYLLKYFLTSLNIDEFFHFDHVVKTDLNDTYTIVRNLFHSQDDLVESSHNLAKLLYEYSMHPKIKGGEMNIAYFSGAVIGDEIVEAVGIFKSEIDVPFIQMSSGESKYRVSHDFGYELKKIDKACLILNSDVDTGFKILALDNSSNSEAQYWKNDFLNIKPLSNDFYQTQEFLGITKNYLTKQISEEFEIDKTDKIDMLNRSMDYFKSHDSFKREDFEREVLREPNLIDSFQKYDIDYRMENEIEMSDQFQISDQAVKKQARVFKSVLKLDKNFHIYIHGNKELIEQGKDPDGRKYYKIYFEEES